MNVKKLLIPLLVLVSGFICETRISQPGGVRRLFIYPECNDTATYLKHKFQPFHVVEYLYVSSRLSSKRIMDKNGVWIVNEFYYDSLGHTRHKVDTFADGLPDKCYELSDSMGIKLQYFADGGYKVCSYGYNRASECRHSGSLIPAVVYDSLYQGKMTGQVKVICDSDYVTDAFTGQEFLKIVHRERQVGTWKVYNAEGSWKDSIVFEADKAK